MKNPSSALAMAQVAQMAFEETLPSGRFYNADNTKAAQQYGNHLALLAHDAYVHTTLPHVFIATLAMANQLNINLSDRLDAEMTGFQPSKMGALRQLTHAFADYAGHDARHTNLHDRIGDNLKDASGLIARVNMANEAPHLRALDPDDDHLTTNFNPRAELEGIIVYTTQDILAVAGALEQINPKKDLTAKKVAEFPALKSLLGTTEKYDLLTATKGMWDRLTQVAKPVRAP